MTSVCAIIITWNPSSEIYKVLSLISPQVKEVIVVDNGSDNDKLQIVSKLASRFSNVKIIQNKENLGIAQALNQGASYAFKNGHEWMITLDDNGLVQPTMVNCLLKEYGSLPESLQQQTAIVAPNIKNLKGPTHKNTNSFFVKATPTSGQLIKTKVWHEIGGYKEDLFISGVDHEFCLRALRHGYKTILVPWCILKATAGPRPEIKNIFGKKIIIPNYKPNRYYYMYRNELYIFKKYWKLAPDWIVHSFYLNVVTLGKIIFFEKQKTKKLFMIARGILHGLLGKYGKLS